MGLILLNGRMSQDRKVAVMTSSSSGIGYGTAIALAKSGIFTYATMRNLQKVTNLESIRDKEMLPLKTLQLRRNR